MYSCYLVCTNPKFYNNFFLYPDLLEAIVRDQGQDKIDKSKVQGRGIIEFLAFLQVRTVKGLSFGCAASNGFGCSENG